jgi:hypothetical protein
MGVVSIPEKALFFTGLLYNSSIPVSRLLHILEEQFGKVWDKTRPRTFIETDYYNAEMGYPVQRLYVVFERLIRMEELPEIKLCTNRMETEMFSRENKRNVNIDPGYITSAKVVLATTKNNQHRIYLKDGIYAEVTLRFQNNSFYPWEWTYRDYKKKETIEFFNFARAHYREVIKHVR